eukprot:CCRYP_002635-RA/>CCRYP_002635-RA protein AED:0.02 eAED:0.02 QI:218/1/1/1/0/0/2/333/618
MNADLAQANHPLPGGDDVASSNKIRSGAPLSSPLEDSSPAAITDNTPTMGTLYITIGPQCSGKTTILKRIFGTSFHKSEGIVSDMTTLAGGIDITIDDQALLYIPVPIQYFLHDSNASDTSAAGVEGKGISPSMMVLGKTIQERICDSSNDELRWVIQRLGGVISSEKFASLLRVSSEQSEHNNPVHVDLVAAVESIISSKDDSEPLPKEVDLFIVESIFRPRPLELIRNITRDVSSPSSSIESSALDAALDQLKSHATNNHTHSRTAPLAWGNTNTRPREYKSALEAASLSRRPVEFIVFGGMETCNMIREHLSRRDYRMSHDVDAAITDNDQIINCHDVDHCSNVEDQYQLRCLPKLTRLELLKRNLKRFAATGKYIPSGAIQDAIVRVESMLASAAAEAKKNVDYSSNLSLEEAKFRLDYELAMLAGYVLHTDRTVSLASNQNVNHGANGRTRTVDLNHESRQYAGGRNGRGRAEGGRCDNESYQGWNPYEGRWNGRGQSNFQRNHYGQIRQDGNNQRGQVWSPHSSHGRSQPRGRSDNDYNSNQQAPNRWGQGRGSSVHSYWQSHNTPYNYQQGNQSRSYSTSQYRHTNALNEYNNSHNEDNRFRQNNYNYQNP